jgi:glycosyltransferase involved in cell wall biosynthesis
MKIKINIINISPKYSSFWKCGYNLYEHLKKDKNYSVKFIDLWESSIISHNNIIRALQLLFGIKFESKKDEINYFVSPLMTKSMFKNKSKKNIFMIHDFYTLKDEKLFLRYLTGNLYSYLKKSDYIITNSNTTKSEYEKYYGENKNIFLNYIGIDDIYFKENLSFKEIKELSFISIGRDEPRKNLEFMIKVLNEIKKNEINFKLFRIGEFSKENKILINEYNLNENIEILEDVNESELIKLYKKSNFLLFPSLYEGFGMPPIEAMACGCIPITSKKGSLKEIVNNHELTLDLNINTWFETILKLIKKDNTKLIKKNYEYAKKFRWEVYTKRVKEIIDEN